MGWSARFKYWFCIWMEPSCSLSLSLAWPSFVPHLDTFEVGFPEHASLGDTRFLSFLPSPLHWSSGVQGWFKILKSNGLSCLRFPISLAVKVPSKLIRCPLRLLPVTPGDHCLLRDALRSFSLLSHSHCPALICNSRTVSWRQWGFGGKATPVIYSLFSHGQSSYRDFIISSLTSLDSKQSFFFIVRSPNFWLFCIIPFYLFLQISWSFRCSPFL